MIPSVTLGVERRGAMMGSFTGAHVVKALLLTCVRWSVAYPLRSRQGEELRQARGVAVDHAPISRWVVT